MIVKKREIPLLIQKLEALLRRLQLNHPKVPLIKENLAKCLAGYKGESSLEFPLSFLSEKNYFIFHDIRLQDEKYFFQIDSLLISRCFILVLEVKNISGSLFFDEASHQLIRTIEGKEDAFPDPILQIDRHEFQLKRWLKRHHIPELPILSLVIISNPYTLIRTSPDNKKLFHKVIHKEFLPNKIKQFENTYQDQKLSEKDLKKIIRLIHKQHTPHDQPILQKYQLTNDQIQIGVQCPNCKHIPIFRIYDGWHCPHCLGNSKCAHLDALKDYSLLIKSTITSSEVRNFLQIESPSLTTRLMKSAGFLYEGTNKGRIYHLSFDD